MCYCSITVHYTKFNAQPDIVAENVIEIYFDAITGTLVYITPSELNWYEFGTNKSHLIARSGEPLHTPQIDAKIGYVFYTQNNEIQALEIDTTDRQNTYALAKLNEPAHLHYDKAAGQLYVLDGKLLKSIAVQ